MPLNAMVPLAAVIVGARALTSLFSELFAMGLVNLVDPAEWLKICLLNRDLGNIMSIFPRNTAKRRVH